MEPQLFILSNGLRVILIDTKAFPTMTTVLFFAAGSRYEDGKNNGIAHFLEHMIFKGSKKYPDFFTISSVLESLGAVHNAFTSKDHTGFWVKSPTKHFEKVIDVMGDIILHPLLPPAEIEKEKGVIIQEMNMYEDNPMRKVGEYFEQLLYPRNSLGMDVIGKKETVTKFQRNNFVDYMQEFYHPKNAVLVVAGGIGLNLAGPVSNSLPRVLANSGRLEKSLHARRSPSFSTPANYYLSLIEEKFAKWSGLRAFFAEAARKAKQGYGGQAGFSKVEERQKKPQTLIHYKKTEQTHFTIGFRTFSFFDKRKYALSLLATMLGGGASSRLFIEVRERRGLCYYIRTGRDHYHDVGYMATQAGVNNNPETIKKAVDTILKEHKKITKGAIEKDELAKVKEIIKGRILLSMEDSANVASWFGTGQILERRIETFEEVIDKVEKVSGDEVVELAKEIFKPEKLNLAVVGPFKQEDLQLSMFNFK